MLYLSTDGFIFCIFFFFKQKTAYEMRISDWSSDVCSSDLYLNEPRRVEEHGGGAIIIAAERDILDADEVANMLHRPGDARGRGVADRGVPIAVAAHAAGRGDAPDMFRGHVAGYLAPTLSAASARADPACRHLSAIAYTRRGCPPDCETSCLPIPS